MKRIIGGIQQIGIGNQNAPTFFKWYKDTFGCDLKVFDDAAEAKLMTRYTGGEVHKRQAIFALNLQGGGGFEIWQFVSREPQKANFDVLAGDLGIFAARIKCKDVAAFHKQLTENLDTWVGELQTTPHGEPHFFLNDPNGNLFNVVQGKTWFKDEKSLGGGVTGAMIGVSNMDKALEFYSKILNYDKVLSDETGVFEDFNGIPGGDKEFRRVLLGHTEERKGPFSQLIGPSTVELVQVLNREPKKIFENRYWGDYGFIHLCYDVGYMDNIEAHCKELGYEFTVDSGKTFDMGDAGGRFCYVEDPDGTLIEMVETHRIPILKKLGWYLKIKEKYRENNLPYWIVNSLRFNRVK